MTNDAKRIEALLEFPLLQALFGRRARRFGLGMEIPSGPLAFRSEKDPLPLTELEQMLLVAAARVCPGGRSVCRSHLESRTRTPSSHSGSRGALLRPQPAWVRPPVLHG
jgi:hypothetical protein